MSQYQSTTGTITVGVPPGGVTQVDDILLVMLAHNSPTACVPPAGWTVALSANNGSAVWSEIYWRRADGTEAATYDFTGVGTICRGNMRGWAGAKRAGSPIGATAFQANATGASANIHQGITTTARNSGLICVIGALGTNSISGRPSQATVQTGTSVNWTTQPIDPAVNRFVNIGTVSFGSSNLWIIASQVMKPDIGTTGTFRTLSGSLTGANVVAMIELLEENDSAYDTPGTRYYPTREQPVPYAYWPPKGTWDSTLKSPRAYDGACVEIYGLSQHTTRNGELRNEQASTNQDQADVLFHKCISPPLEAQTISGTLDICNRPFIARNDSSVGNPIPDGYYKVHVYVTVGQTEAVRGVLLDNYVDATTFTGNCQSLFAAQALTPVVVTSGDCLVIEIGYRVVARTPYPTPTRSPSQWAVGTFEFCTNFGANFGSASSCGPPFVDMIPGSNLTGLAPWFLFSDTIVELAQSPTPPANASCATPAVVGSVPYDSGALDTHGMTEPYRRLWWEFTVPSDGRYIFYAIGGTVQVGMQMATTCPPVGLSYQTGVVQAVGNLSYTSVGILVKDCTAGETFLLSTCIKYNGNGGLPGDGTVRMRIVKERPLANNDVIVGSAGYIARYTQDGDLAAISTDFAGSSISGLAIDYTRRPMDDFNGGLNTTDRLYVGLFGVDIIEILDINTLNAGQPEIDFISDVLGRFQSPSVNRNLSSFAMTPAGMLTVGWFGNGFIYVAANAASYLTAAATLGVAQLNTLDATHADDQAGAPWPPAQLDPVDLQVGGSNYVEYGQSADDADVVYYTSGGWYRPVGGTTIYRFNPVTRTQLAPFATGLVGTGPNPGVKGLFPLPQTPTTPDGGCLVCNGSIVQRLDVSGAVVATYTPSPASKAMSLADVELQADGRYFWVWDEASSSLFKFDMETGLQVLGPDTVDGLWTQLSYGSSTSIVIYRSEPFPTGSEVRMTQLPLQAAYDYALLRRALNANALRWETPPPSQ